MKRGRVEVLADQVIHQDYYARFTEKGLPKRVDEAWRYSRADWLGQSSWAIPEMDEKFQQIEGPGGVLHFAKGQCQWTQLPEGVSLEVTDHMGWRASDIKDSLVDLIQAITPVVYVLKVSSGVKVKTPISIKISNDQSHILMPVMLQVICEEGAELVIQENLELQKGAAMMMVQATVANRANLKWARLDGVSNGAYALRYLHAEVAEKGFFEQGHLGAVAGQVKSLSQIDLMGENAKANCLSVALSRNKEIVDHQTTIRHQASLTTSLQKCRSLLDDDSLQVFNSKVKVDEGIRKVDSEQQHKSMLLSKSARVYTKPELEIYADDVRCNHGAAVGQFDPLALFYLKSRGMDDVGAKSLMVKAFVGDILALWSSGIQGFLTPRLEEVLAKWVT
ncbi:MAG TPA: SufD family Fe-S cluster assembly protein [Gammaproteobacteria bacterium]|nr:SufD family Fe-S cluster assembly protein [Gammaproteobacteria bacterium]